MKNLNKWVIGVLLILNSNLSFGIKDKIATKLYVANEDDGTISVINPKLNLVSATIDLMSTGPSGMEMFMAHNVQSSPDSKTVWVTAPATDQANSNVNLDDEVIVIDPVSDKIIKRIALGKELHLAHVVLDAASKNAFVTAFNTSEIYKIDAKKYQVTSIYKLSKDAGPHGARICGSKLFVAEMGKKGLAILDTLTGLIKEIHLGGVAVQTACTIDGKFAFVSMYDTKEVVRLNISSGEVLRIPLSTNSEGPVQIYLSADQKTLYVADQGVLMGRPASDLFFAIDVENGSIKSSIKVGSGPHGVVASPDGKSIYVTNMVDNTVSTIESSTQKLLSTIKVGNKPNGISIWTPAKSKF